MTKNNLSFKEFFFNTNVIAKSRLPWVDYTKGIAIILVIYRHVWYGLTRAGLDMEHYMFLKHANDVVYSFRMPLFFILSGIFISKSLAKRSIAQFTKNKFNTLLYPYFVWAIIQITLQIFFSKYANADRSWIDYTYIIVQPRKIDQLWYLISLFNVTILYMFFKAKVKLKIWQQILFGLALYYLSVYLLPYSLIHDVMYYYVFYAIGDFVSSRMLNKNYYKYYSSYWLLIVLIPIFLFTQQYYLQHQDNINMFVFAGITILGCAFLLNVSFILEKLNILRFLRIVGYHSLYIYVMHVLITSCTRVVLTRVFGITNIPFLLFFSIFIGVLLSLMIYNLIIRLGGWYLFTYDKSKKKEIAVKLKLGFV